MNNNDYEEMIHLAPFGYAYHEVILDDKGNAIDYIFLDMNKSFELMTGFEREKILNKNVTHVLPQIRIGQFDWVDFYGKVALNGEKQEFTEYAEPLNRWYKVTAFSTKKGYFTTFIQDVTIEMDQMIELEKQKSSFETISRELEIIFNSTQDAMVLIQVDDGKFTFIRNNEAHQKATGISIEEINGKKPSHFFGQEMGEIIEKKYRECVEKREPVIYERILELPTGKKTWLTCINPVIENKDVVFIVAASKDITLEKTIEKEKEDLLQRSKAVFNEHTAVILNIESESGHGRIIDANPAALSFYGYSREEILKLHIQDINILSQSEIEKIKLRALSNNQKYFLFPHRLKNGEIRFVDVYSSPIRINGKKERYSIIFDVTDREEYKMKLFHEKELLRTTLLSIGDGVVTTDKVGSITSMNKVAEEITGWTQKEARGKSFSEVFKLISETTLKEVENPIEIVLRSGKIVGLANHTALINKYGDMIPVADSAAPIKDEKGNIFGVVMVVRDVSKEKEQMDRILYLSYYDTLTGLYNRGFMEEELLRIDSSNETPCGVILGDLNGLKLVNDVFGHASGDELLICAANIITECCRKEDIIARWGGDEFLILLPKTDALTIERIVQRIMDKCLEDNKDGTQVSIALGYAVKKNDYENINKTIKDAEEHMYRRKLLEGKSFRNSIINTMISTLFSKSMETEAHASRLKDHCVEVANRLELSSKDLDELVLLAVLHDIGKVAIDESILMKSGSLTEQEWVEMRKHPEIGYRIAHNIPELVSVADYILHHHERWDGKGYPHGLKREEIPIHCRILSVVDAYDAMTNDRYYRKAMNSQEALEELRRNSGKQFDERVVDTFLQYIEGKDL
ncbi:PAS domain S-box protein [Alkalibaculum sporogenes]|nr:PAS domain S-box protein [Alkalibaculum sporogenes]